MKDQPDHIDKILPYGEILRGFANQSFITTGDLKSILRSRGIFFNESDKSSMVPVLVSLLLSPKEFDELRDCQNTREDNQKSNSSTIKWESEDNLTESLSSDVSIRNVVDTAFTNYDFINEPRFIMQDGNPNKLLMEYEIERNDRNKAWYESKNRFKGSILIEKINNGSEVKFVHTHTASETKDIGEKFTASLIRDFKSKRKIEETQNLQKITFSEFSNEDRVVFFWRLTSNIDSIYYKFKDVVDIEFKADEKALPAEIEWMKKKRELILKGDELHETFFIKDKLYHPHLIFWKLDAKFQFDYNGARGQCVVSFGFPGLIKYGDLDAEFEINIAGISFETNLTAGAKANVKENLLKRMDEHKMKVYRKFKEYMAEKPSSNLITK